MNFGIPAFVLTVHLSMTPDGGVINTTPPEFNQRAQTLASSVVTVRLTKQFFGFYSTKASLLKWTFTYKKANICQKR